MHALFKQEKLAHLKGNIMGGEYGCNCYMYM